jgi:RNA-directed DNA polymerase
MRREPPVRIREGLGVQFPRATRLVMGFSCDEDARKVMEVLPKRFEKYGLTIHPDKTRLVPFERPSDAREVASSAVRTPPGTFDLLGFTHYWARSRHGNWVVKRKTSGSRFRRGLKALSEWCRLNRRRPMEDQHRTLSQKLVGHFAYYGITGNSLALNRFRIAATWLWKRWLSRRRRRGSRMTWDRLNRFLKRHPLPPAIAVHSVCRPVALT